MQTLQLTTCTIALRIVYKDNISTFQELLNKDGSMTIHHQNLHYLAIEMYKGGNDIGPSFMANIFPKHPNICNENIAVNTR